MSKRQEWRVSSEEAACLYSRDQMKLKKELKLPLVTPELGQKVATACRKGCEGDLSRDIFTTCCRSDGVAAVDIVAVTRHLFPDLRDTEPLSIAVLVTAIDGWLSVQQAA